jgi:TPR repeat protein
MRYMALSAVLVFLFFISGLTAQSGAAWEAAGWLLKTAGQAVVGYYVVKQLDKYTPQRAPSGTPEGNYNEGLRYLRAGDETRAVESLKKSADSEYSLAQCVLGDLAFKNLDYAAARESYQKAAVKHNHSWAQFQMGNLAAYGYLGRTDYEGALYWYRLAAKQRDSRAEHALGTLLLSGLAHPPSEAEKREAAGLIEDAAKQGLPSSEAEMSYILAEGIGRPQDFCAAVGWAKRAAQKGAGAALFNLGVASHNGDCLPQDNLLAVSYYRQAIQAGYQAASAELNRTVAYLQQELQRLSQAAPQARMCTVPDSEAPVYDLNGNVTGRLTLRLVSVTASELNNDFVRLNDGQFLPSKSVMCPLLNLLR